MPAMLRADQLPGYIAAMEHDRALRLKKMEARIDKAQEKCVVISAAMEAMLEQHARQLASDEAAAQRKEEFIRKRADEAISVAEARASAARQKREALEAELRAVYVDMAKLEKEHAQQRKDLAEQVAAADVRTSQLALDTEVQVAAMRAETEQAVKITFDAVHQEGRRIRQMQDAFAGLKEVVTGVTACDRDHQLRSIPQIKERPFDVPDHPFRGMGKFGSSKPPKTPKGFLEDVHAATACSRR